MSYLNSRVNKLEQGQGVGKAYKYMHIRYEEGVMGDPRMPEEKEKGLKIQPWAPAFGGNGGEPFYLETQAELEAFAARPDVELTILVVVRASEVDEAPDRTRPGVTAQPSNPGRGCQ